jgi:uncharacterized protein
MDRQEVLAMIAALQLPEGKYVVVGGAAMAARGLRDTNDIDLVVTPELFGQLARSGWSAKQRPIGKPGLYFGTVEAYLDVNTPTFARDTDWLIEHAEHVKGTRLVDLDTLVGCKRTYGREKDLRDVAILEANRGGARGASPGSIMLPEADASDQSRFLAITRSNYANDQILRRLPELGLPDSLLVAGSLFQAAWNVQSGKAPDADILDYDIFYFDASDVSWEAEDAAIGLANRVFGDLGVPVQVRNQARVHLWYESKFGIPCKPLVSSEDGIDHFLNQSSCFGIRPGQDRAEVYAPFGYSDLHAMIVRPNRRRELPAAYADKAARWKKAWPLLTVLPWESEARARDVAEQPHAAIGSR